MLIHLVSTSGRNLIVTATPAIQAILESHGYFWADVFRYKTEIQDDLFDEIDSLINVLTT